MNPIIQRATASHLKSEAPEVRVGDRVIAVLKVVEGGRERLQNFEGLVIAKKGSHINASIRIRKISHNEVGVEKVLLLHSPMLHSIKVLKHNKPRRAKLYYLRGRKGKSAMKV